MIFIINKLARPVFVAVMHICNVDNKPKRSQINVVRNNHLSNLNYDG